MTHFANKIDMQNRLFAALSAMFGKEVPLYDKSLLVNMQCNKAVCAMLGAMYPGFALSEEQIDKTSGERHGAIRIGRPDEYRWISRFFACFAMLPHNFYDMTSVGSKSQPIIATAFRSVLHPEHRVFSSLLMTDYFDLATKARIENLLAPRAVFSARAKELIEKSERQGGLSNDDAEALIREGTDRIFKWTGKARDYQLYKELSDSGFKIAADIACFESHHLNHLTPNTFCMDLYTSAMKFCLGELPEAAFRTRATNALNRLRKEADRDYLRLTFKHLTSAQIDALPAAQPPASLAEQLAGALITRLQQPDLHLTKLNHAGFKDFTEGPAEDTPVFLRQDAYKALTEPVVFTNPDGTTLNAVHTARFGEIEQRTYAATPAGRKLYDQCLANAEADRDKDPGLAKRDFAAYEAMYAKHFAPFPKTLGAMVEKGYVYAHFFATPKGRAAKGTIGTTDIRELIALGYLGFEGLRYEDFLPVSAAGIFASNLNQYGTKTTATVKPTYTQQQLEQIMGRPIIDTNAVYHGLQAESLLESFEALDLLGALPPAQRAELERLVDALPTDARRQRSEPRVPTAVR